jgi:hypothetical protein
MRESEMLNLYWKSDGQTRSLIEKSFGSETAFEEYIFENQDILGDVYVIHRQIRTGSKEGIPDMLGVDQDARICIIELKNHEASEDILPQALGYAIWAETNPDSIKAIWLESEQKPEDVEIDWDSLDIRVILIAPSFKNTVPRMAGKIGYPIDLMEVRRYCFEQEEFLVVEVLAEEKVPKASTTKTMGEWDWEYYESEHGKEATAQFRKAVEAIESFVLSQGWNLPYNLNKYYTGFKLGNRVVFNVHWGGTYAWNLRLKLPEGVAEGFEGKHWEFQRYSSNFKEAILRPLNPDSPKVGELESLLIQAYKNVSGAK